MKKKLRISDAQKSNIFKSLNYVLNGKTEVNFDLDLLDLYDSIKFGKKLKNTKNVGDTTFFKSRIPETNDPAIMMFVILEFPIKDKDSIKLNNYIIKTIEYYEKLFITLDVVKIIRHNDYTTNNNYIFIKILKKVDDTFVKDLRMENYMEEQSNINSEETVEKERSVGFIEDYCDETIDPTNIFI